jgi:hypothetical protein
MEEGMEWTVFKDSRKRGDWRVEAPDFDEEGQLYITIFSGPEARERAEEYAEWKNSQLRMHAA